VLFPFTTTILEELLEFVMPHKPILDVFLDDFDVTVLLVYPLLLFLLFMLLRVIILLCLCDDKRTFKSRHNELKLWTESRERPGSVLGTLHGEQLRKRVGVERIWGDEGEICGIRTGCVLLHVLWTDEEADCRDLREL
jgi:hypothetical protein